MSSSYAKLFETLPAFSLPNRSQEEADAWLTRLAERMLAPEEDQPAGDNPRIPAGYTYLGQFINHDLTFAVPSPLVEWRRPLNLRAPSLDLDCVYGQGPRGSPHLYDFDAEGRRRGLAFRIGRANPNLRVANFEERDLPRAERLFAAVLERGPKHAPVVICEERAVFRDVSKESVEALAARWPSPTIKIDPLESRIEWVTLFEAEVSPQDVIRRPGGCWVSVRGPGMVKTTAGWRRASPDSIRCLGDVALIADPRNDDHVVIGQLHLAFLRLHNRLLDKYVDASTDPQKCFDLARRELTWHYQWMVVHDFLPRLVGEDLVTALLHPNGRASKPVQPVFRCPTQTWLPLEFAFAAFRFGHAMVRSGYRLNDVSSLVPHTLFSADTTRDRMDLRGSKTLAERWTVQWELFVETAANRHQSSRRIRPLLSRSLEQGVSAVDGDPTSLAVRNLRAGMRVGVASGPAIAAALGVATLPAWDLANEADEPLWHYVLREAAETNQGEKLGPVGARLTAEVICGLVRDDSRSFLHQSGWQPTLGVDAGRFVLLDLLRAAEMPIERADLARAGIGDLTPLSTLG